MTIGGSLKPVPHVLLGCKPFFLSYCFFFLEICRETTRSWEIVPRTPCIREPKFQAQKAFCLVAVAVTIHRRNIAKSYTYMRTFFVFAIHGTNRPCKPWRLKHGKTYTFWEKRAAFEFCTAFRAYFRQHQGCKEFRSKNIVFSHKPWNLGAHSTEELRLSFH